MKQGLILLLLSISANFFAQNKTVKVLQVPAETQFSTINTEGVSIIPSGRFITPVGKTLRITRSPFGMAVAPDESKILVWHQSGVLTVIDPKNAQNTEGGVTRIPSYDGKIPSLNSDAFIGVVFSKDSKTAYLSGGDKGNVIVFDVKTNSRVDSIELNQTFDNKNFVDSWTSDIAINADKNELYVLDRGNFRLVKIDLNTKRITASIPVGRIPFGIALSPDKKTAFVANVGLYEYKAIPGVTPTNKDSMMLMFHLLVFPRRKRRRASRYPMVVLYPLWVQLWQTKRCRFGQLIWIEIRWLINSKQDIKLAQKWKKWTSWVAQVRTQLPWAAATPTYPTPPMI